MNNDFTFRINGTEITVNQKTLTGRQILERAGLNPPEGYELLLETDKNEFDFIRLDEEVNLQIRGVENFQAQEKDLITITVDNQEVQTRSLSTPIEILAKVGKGPDQFFLVEIRNEIEISLKNDDNATLNLANGAVFITKDRGENGHAGDRKIRLKFVVNGEEFEDEFNINQNLKDAVVKALDETCNSNQPLSRWTVTYEGKTLEIDKKIKEFEFPECAVIMISLKSAQGGV